MFAAFYERFARVGIPPHEVDEMEVWQAVAALGMWRDENEVPVVPEGPVRGRAIDDKALIRARLEAHRRGEGEPTWIFGEPRVPQLQGAGDGR